MIKDKFSSKRLEENHGWWKELKAKVQKNKLQTEVNIYSLKFSQN